MNIKEFFPKPVVRPKKVYTVENEVQDEFNEFCKEPVAEDEIVLVNKFKEELTTEFNDFVKEDGKIVQDVNTTVDVGMDEIKIQSAKMGFDVTTGGVPAYLTPDGVHPIPNVTNE